MKRRKVLFVCTGNTCRSPMAEALLRRMIKERKIKFVDALSVGLKVQKNDVINPFTQAVLEENGLTMPKFKPRQVNKKLLDGAFVVITMTDAQKEYFKDDERVFSMKDVAGFEIPDPYGQGMDAYRQTYLLIERATKKIADSIVTK